MEMRKTLIITDNSVFRTGYQGMLKKIRKHAAGLRRIQSKNAM